MRKIALRYRVVIVLTYLLKLPNDEHSLPRRGLWRGTDQRREKREFRKRRNKLHGQAGSVPQVPDPQVCWIRGTGK